MCELKSIASDQQIDSHVVKTSFIIYLVNRGVGPTKNVYDALSVVQTNEPIITQKLNSCE